MNESSTPKWKFYHQTQPYFFAHHHFHLRKIEILRNAGIDAGHLVFVPKKIYLKNHLNYREAEKNKAVKVIIIPSQKLYFIYAFFFFIKDLLNEHHVLVHFLRSSPWPVMLLKQLPFIGRKIHYIQEFEGDSYCESLYSERFNETSITQNKTKELLKSLLRKVKLFKDCLQVKFADGIVLMSQEHVNLWESRLKQKLNSLILPTLSDPNKIWFDESEREIVRNKLDLNRNLVITYVGNIVSPWQRREAMCEFISNISKKIPELKFLALVREDDVLLMQETLKKYNIQDLSIIKSVPHNEIYKYLSAADLAIFLRHNHMMNRIVTSGKLGEYLSAGLPVITTGSNAEILNMFIKENEAGFFIDDEPIITNSLLRYLISKNKNDNSLRIKVSQSINKQFSYQNDPFNSYLDFILNKIKD